MSMGSCGWMGPEPEDTRARAQSFRYGAHRRHHACNSRCPGESLCTCVHTDRGSCLTKNPSFNHSSTGNTEGVAREKLLQKAPGSKNGLCRPDLGPAFDQLNFSQVLLWDQSQAARRQEEPQVMAGR